VSTVQDHDQEQAYRALLNQAIEALAAELVATQREVAMLTEAAERASRMANVRVSCDYAPATSDDNTGNYL
jgi:hypothetical protein